MKYGIILTLSKEWFRIDIFPEDGLEVGIFIIEEMKYKKFLNLLLLDP